MKPSARRRLEVETLETLMLPSTVLADPPPPLRVVGHLTPLPVTVTLSGTAQLTRDAHQRPDLHSDRSYSGSALFPSIGPVSVHEVDGGGELGPTVTLSNRDGKLFLLTDPLNSRASSAGYTLSGSGDFSWATGSGTIHFSVTGAGSHQKHVLKFV